MSEEKMIKPYKEVRQTKKVRFADNEIGKEKKWKRRKRKRLSR